MERAGNVICKHTNVHINIYVYYIYVYTVYLVYSLSVCHAKRAMQGVDLDTTLIYLIKSTAIFKTVLQS